MTILYYTITIIGSNYYGFFYGVIDSLKVYRKAR